jgi:outer membrane protein
MTALFGRLLPLLLVLALAVLGAERAVAQAALPAPVIIIVDMQQILQDSKAAKDVQSVLNQQYSAYSKEVAQQEDELQKGGAELERQRTVLAGDVYNGRARELQQRYDDLSKAVQARRQAFQQSLNEAMGKVRSAALEVVADIVKERKANLVLEKQAVVFEAEGLDVTADAIQRLDKKLPNVPVNLPKVESAPAKAPAPALKPPAKP